MCQRNRQLILGTNAACKDEANNSKSTLNYARTNESVGALEGESSPTVYRTDNRIAGIYRLIPDW